MKTFSSKLLHLFDIHYFTRILPTIFGNYIQFNYYLANFIASVVILNYSKNEFLARTSEFHSLSLLIIEFKI